jgi:hypothetical protein
MYLICTRRPTRWCRCSSDAVARWPHRARDRRHAHPAARDGIPDKRSGSGRHAPRNPAPIAIRPRQFAVGVRAAYFLEQFFRAKTATERDGHQMLHQHVERLVRHRTTFDLPFGDGMRRHRLLPETPGCWSAPASRARRVPAHDRCVRLAAADVQRPSRCRSAARVRPARNRRRGPGSMYRYGFQFSLLHPCSTQSRTSLSERAVMQRDQAGPVGPRG